MSLSKIANKLNKLAAPEARSGDIKTVMSQLIPQMVVDQEDTQIDPTDLKTLNTVIAAGKQMEVLAKNCQRIDTKLAMAIDAFGKALQGM